MLTRRWFSAGREVGMQTPNRAAKSVPAAVRAIPSGRKTSRSLAAPMAALADNCSGCLVALVRNTSPVESTTVIHPSHDAPAAATQVAPSTLLQIATDWFRLTASLRASCTDASNSFAPLARRLPLITAVKLGVAIAKRREVFVSEAILIGSAKDNKAAIIEVSPENMDVFEVKNSDVLICSNHFQSETYLDDKRNLKWIEESHSGYRFARMKELISEAAPESNNNLTIDVPTAVSILRNKEGLGDKKIGYGNEKALNQLLAHHGIVFKPEEKQLWVSSNPYQLGEFVSYDLDEIFSNRAGNPSRTSLSNAKLNVPEDPFVHSMEFRDYEEYRVLESRMETAIRKRETVSPETINALWRKNPDYWKAYYLIGKYYFGKNYDAAAKNAFEMALTKEITTVPDRENIEKYLRQLKR